MPHFDFHVHPTMKCLFSDPPTKFSPWEVLNVGSIPWVLKQCTEFPQILRSQANLNQLWWNECRLVCVALYAPERNLLDNDLILGQADGPLGIYLNPQKIQRMLGGASPFKLVTDDDLDTLLHPEKFGVTNKKIVPLTRALDYDETKADTIFVVFSVEGCHSFSSTLGQFDKQDIMSNMDALSANVPLISINLTHMEQSPLCNHAYGMQFLPNEAFKPTGSGLHADGAQIVKHCYDKKIMVDIKHMSLMARQQLYNLRRTHQFQTVNQPLICTHAGFAGITMAEIPDFIYYKRNLSAKGYGMIYLGKPLLQCSTGVSPSFNPSSINLYDEDIIEILRSGGLIGFSLDKRILGFADPTGKQVGNQERYPLEVEYFSLNEQQYFYSKDHLGQAFDDGHCIEYSDMDDVARVKPGLADYHLLHFMGHIIHLIKVASREAYDVNKALGQVCIGSDFDGMINPILICETTDHLVYFREQFERYFVEFAANCQVALPNGFNVNAFAQGLFYDNGKEFVLQRLAQLNP